MVLPFLTLLLTSCGGKGIFSLVPTVKAQAPSTVITGPTQITSEQFGNFTVQSGSLFGPPAATGHAVKIHGTVTVTGPALLQDLFVDGCVVVDHANRVEVVRVWVQGCAGDGITFLSDPNPNGNQSCCGKLDHVVAHSNGAAGLKLLNTADIFIANSEFERNHDCGVRLVNSPTTRIVSSDFGGNVVCGLWADPTSHMTMLSNSQWGNNQGDDLVLQSQNNIVNGDEFIGPAGACAVRGVGPQSIGTNFYGPRSLCLTTGAGSVNSGR
jgi:Right handed beta helix region